jgi:hypothetical protein
MMNYDDFAIGWSIFQNGQNGGFKSFISRLMRDDGRQTWHRISLLGSSPKRLLAEASRKHPYAEVPLELRKIRSTRISGVPAHQELGAPPRDHP